MFPVKSTGTWGISAMLERRRASGSCGRHGNRVRIARNAILSQACHKSTTPQVVLSFIVSCPPHLGDVDAINLNGSAIDLSQPEKAANHAGFPSTRAAHDSDLVSMMTQEGVKQKHDAR